MTRLAVAAALALVLLAGCATTSMRSADPPGYYYLFLVFAEALVGEVSATGCCDAASAQQWVDIMRARQARFVQESRGADWGERFEKVKFALARWLRAQHDKGHMNARQYLYFMKMLVAWR